MAVEDIGFRARAASLFRPRATLVPYSLSNEKNGEHDTLDEGPSNEKVGYLSTEGQSPSLSSSDRRPRSPRDHREPRENSIRLIRTIPAWVHTLDEEEDSQGVKSSLLPQDPPTLQIAQHNNSPATKHNVKSHHPRGRLYDALREDEPHILSTAPTEEIASRWRSFANASAYPPAKGETGFCANEDWLDRNGPDYSQPWLAGESGDNGGPGGSSWKSKKRFWYIKAQHTILRNPVIPLVLRSTVWTFSLVALALAASIHHFTDSVKGLYNTPSTDMAIVVDAIALAYILYISWDEYHGKPLGLRDAKAKMRLIFLDLFFIVFDSANLSLAFEAVTDSQSLCRQYGTAQRICRRERALASVLLIALIAWLSTFSISVLRVVEKMR